MTLKVALIGKWLARQPYVVGFILTLILLIFQPFQLLTWFGIVSVIGFSVILFILKSSFDETLIMDWILTMSAFAIVTFFLHISPLMLTSAGYITRIFQALIIPTIYGMTVMFRHHSKVHTMTMIQVILAILIVFTWIALGATLVSYGPFYRLIYQNQVYFFEGERYRIADEMIILFQSQWLRVHPRFFEAILTMLIAPVVLMFNGKKFFIQHPIIIISVITGFVGIILLPNFMPIVFIIPALIWMLFLHLLPSLKARFKNINQLVFVASMVVLVTGIVVFVISTFNLLGLGDALNQIPGIRQVLQQRFVLSYQAILRTMIAQPFETYPFIILGNQFLYTSHSIVFDTLHQGGWFAFIGVIILFIFIVNLLAKKPSPSHWSMHLKLLSVMFLSVFVVWMFTYPLFPYVRENQRWDALIWINHPLTFILIALLGFAQDDPLGLFMKSKPNSAIKSRIKKSQSSLLNEQEGLAQ